MTQKPLFMRLFDLEQELESKQTGYELLRRALLYSKKKRFVGRHSSKTQMCISLNGVPDLS